MTVKKLQVLQASVDMKKLPLDYINTAFLFLKTKATVFKSLDIYFSF